MLEPEISVERRSAYPRLGFKSEERYRPLPSSRTAPRQTLFIRFVSLAVVKSSCSFTSVQDRDHRFPLLQNRLTTLRRASGVFFQFCFFHSLAYAVSLGVFHRVCHQSTVCKAHYAKTADSGSYWKYVGAF